MADPSIPGSLRGAPAPADEVQLEEFLSRPRRQTVEAMAHLRGDILVLGAGGKMGLSFAAMAARSLRAAGATSRRVIAVSRFHDGVERFHEAGVETIEADLLDQGALAALPDAPNVLYLAGMKFGSSGAQSLTWAMNVLLPGLVVRRFPRSRIVALSSGNVYAFTDVQGGGSREEDEPGPVGEYAVTCLGRERLLEHGSRAAGTPVTLIRLNYANALRYGVLVDICQQVLAGEPVDVSMGERQRDLAGGRVCSDPGLVRDVRVASCGAQRGRPRAGARALGRRTLRDAPGPTRASHRRDRGPDRVVERLVPHGRALRRPRDTRRAADVVDPRLGLEWQAAAGQADRVPEARRPLLGEPDAPAVAGPVGRAGTRPGRGRSRHIRWH